MKLLAPIGTDYHLNQLPHFLAHYAAIGVDQFVCGLHGRYYEQDLNVHHFRWDDRAASQYQALKRTRHYRFVNGRVPDLHGVFAVDPPFPPVGSKEDARTPAADPTASASNAASPPAVIWVVGDGRSGTTWLVNLINYRQAYRFMFEPLHPRLWGTLLQANPYLYLSPQTSAEYLPLFRQIFSGQLRNGRLDRYNQVRNHDHGLVIKDIFGHFCLKGVDQHFPQVKKVLLLRHPFAVALSKLKLRERGWDWLNEPQRLFDHPQLYADFLHPFVGVLQDVASNFEKQVLVWAIIHYVALVQLNGAQIHLVFYEELCANFEQEMRRLLAYLGEDVADQPLDERLLAQYRTPSQTTTEWSAISQNSDLLDGWRQQLTAEELGMGDYILNVFGLGQIYNSSRLLPNRQAAEFILKAASLADDLASSAPAPQTPVSTRLMDAPSTTRTALGKLAYLIIAHHQPNHLARLIQALDDENSFFFIHIDEKVAIAPFQAAVGQHANLVFLPNRVSVHWAKFGVVQALLNLLQTAVASGHAFTYYTVLSGSDYPIKHKQEIYTRLQASDRQFLRIDRKLINEAKYSHRHIIKDLPQGQYFGNLTPYHGSMYWSLTADCIRFILDFVDNNPAYVAIHHHIFAPDEVFFHTLVKHSPFAGAITHDFSEGNYPDHLHHGNHFIDWSGRRKRVRLTLDERDFDELSASPMLFARKFDEQMSSKLLDLLDQQIHCSGVKESVYHG